MSEASKQWVTATTTCSAAQSKGMSPERESASSRSKAFSFSCFCSSGPSAEEAGLEDVKHGTFPLTYC